MNKKQIGISKKFERKFGGNFVVFKSCRISCGYETQCKIIIGSVSQQVMDEFLMKFYGGVQNVLRPNQYNH